MRLLGVSGAQADAITVIGQAGPLSLKELGELLIAESGHPEPPRRPLGVGRLGRAAPGGG